MTPLNDLKTKLITPATGLAALSVPTAWGELAPLPPLEPTVPDLPGELLAEDRCSVEIGEPPVRGRFELAGVDEGLPGRRAGLGGPGFASSVGLGRLDRGHVALIGGPRLAPGTSPNGKAQHAEYS